MVNRNKFEKVYDRKERWKKKRVKPRLILFNSKKLKAHQIFKTFFFRFILLFYTSFKYVYVTNISHQNDNHGEVKHCLESVLNFFLFFVLFFVWRIKKFTLRGSCMEVLVGTDCGGVWTLNKNKSTWRIIFVYGFTLCIHIHCYVSYSYFKNSKYRMCILTETQRELIVVKVLVY